MTHCRTAPIALPSLDTATTDELLAFTRDVVRLCPAEEWHAYVAEAIWQCSLPDVPPVRPVAYVRRIARRLRHAAEASSLGRQEVRGRHRRVLLGHVTVCGYVRPDGSISEECLEGGALLYSEAGGYVPARDPDGEPSRQGRRHRPWVETDDLDERSLQRAQADGIPRREMAERLGWTSERAEAVWRRLYRRRRAIP